MEIVGRFFTFNLEYNQFIPKFCITLDFDIRLQNDSFTDIFPVYHLKFWKDRPVKNESCWALR